MESMKSVLKYAIALLAVAGIVVSSMALHVHLMDSNAPPPCAVSEHWDRPHVPVAALGIAAYAVIAILALLGRTWLVFELAQVGFLFAAFLSYIEAYVIEMWCIYCVWSQGIIAAIFLLSALALLLEWRKRRAGSNGAAASAPVDPAQ
jgi:hypothetical protein